MKSKRSQSRRGLLAGGNWIIDQVKVIDVYPKPEQLANIHRQSQGTGGAPYNVLIDLARLGVSFPLFGAGLVGRDELGQSILKDCRQHKISTRHLRSTAGAPTSYTDVMTERKGGRRTFFHNRGANALWKGEDLDFKALNIKIFHLGYLLLLDSLDEPNARYGTRAAAVLAKARKLGIKTSVDVVSEESTRFERIVVPALKHVDYCIINELEAGNTVGLKIRKSNGKLDTGALRESAKALLDRGVHELVAIHSPEGGFVRTRDGCDLWQSSLRLPESYIAGTAGAGDAFCAGMLLGLHEGWELSRCLLTAVCAAAASLSDPTCTKGMRTLAQTLALAKRYRPGPALIQTAPSGKAGSSG